ncbi:MAG: efflux RND transporter permease subunit, partial [Rikenellaceae bacterium]|nr:efflux RND transporter permease subunit [Rikenellaceae bacterium]
MSLSEFSLRRSSVVYFVLMLFVVGGIWSFIRMGKKEDSTFVLKSAVVTCDYAGATPFEVEQLISEPVSRELQSMRRIKKITSESYYGHARIMVELESGVRAREIPQLWDELRRKVENISSSLPAAAGPLRVDDDISDVYGLYYALAADEGFSWDEIRSWAQQLKREIVAIDGVQKVALKGEQQPVVNIYITKSTLANFSISPEMIAATLSQQNNIVDTGEIDASQVRVRILEPGTYSTIEDIADQLLIAPDGRQFRLGDITRIKQGYVDPPTVVMKVDGRRAVGIGVASDEDADVVRLGGEVEALLARFESQMPVGMDILTLYPEDQIARRANLSFMLNLLESVAIVIVVIMLSMGFRAGSLIGLSLIFTIGGTMLCMYGLGEGINRTSLAGFIIAMGMLVDNAIVVVDNAIRGV